MLKSPILSNDIDIDCVIYIKNQRYLLLSYDTLVGSLEVKKSMKINKPDVLYPLGWVEPEDRPLVHVEHHGAEQQLLMVALYTSLKTLYFN